MEDSVEPAVLDMVDPQLARLAGLARRGYRSLLGLSVKISESQGC
jgi:hypothetical protein